jgi:hypothetical protein
VVVTDKGLLVTAANVGGEPFLLGISFEGELVMKKALPQELEWATVELADFPITIIGDDVVVIPVTKGLMAVRVPVGRPDPRSWSMPHADVANSRRWEGPP